VKCIVCGEDFKQTHGSQKCCSTKCAKENHANYNRKCRASKTANSGKNCDHVIIIKNKRIKDRKIIDKFQEVIDAQNGPIDELYERSKHWNKAQREFAKERYKKIYLAQ
jgi:hypothetical protein